MRYDEPGRCRRRGDEDIRELQRRASADQEGRPMPVISVPVTSCYQQLLFQGGAQSANIAFPTIADSAVSRQSGCQEPGARGESSHC